MQGKEIRFEDHGGRKMFLTKLSGLKKFEKRMLSESGCQFFLPMQFINDESDEWAYYDYTGCLKLSEYLQIKEQAADYSENKGKHAILILDVIGDLLQCLKGMEKYLIFPDTVSIDPDMLFIDTESGKAILAYHTNPAPEHPLKTRIIDTIEKIAENCQDTESTLFLSNLIKQINEKNPGLDGMISMLDKMKRDLNFIYWEPESFRNSGSDSSCSEGNLHESSIEAVIEDKLKRFARLNYKNRGILPLMTGASILCLAGAYLTGLCDVESFAGLAFLAAGANLILFRKLAPNIKNRKV